MKKLRFAICGAGSRGSRLTTSILCTLEAVRIVAVCDLFLEKAQALAQAIREKSGDAPEVYTDYRAMLAAAKADAILIATSVETHSHIAIAAMEKGVAVGMEVGGAAGQEECFRLVEAYERTKTPFMFLENCCYGKAELFAANLKKQGVLGQVVYCHGSYMHDCRELYCKGDGKGYNFRLDLWAKDNSDFYPTHELGPIAKLLDICRGNRLVSLTSRASCSKGLQDYIARTPGLEHLKDTPITHGDIVQTLISCENGELISMRLDTTLPTYYSREITVRGTRGQFRQDGNIVTVDGDVYKNFDAAVNSGDRFTEAYLPQVWKTISPEAQKAGHGGMDHLMLVSFVDALLKGREMPVDVYDAATWMSIGYLSRQSIAQGGSSVEIPDFTRGAYKTRPPLDVVAL